MQDFAHLHVHTEYSLLDGFSRIKTLVKQAKAYGMKHLAITDHGNMHGVMEFYLECQEQGIRPIVGQEAYLTDDMERRSGKNNDYNHLVILAKDQTGYQNLMRLTTEAHTRGLYYGKPRMDKKLLEKYNQGLIVTSSCLGGEIPELIVKKQDMTAAKKAIRWYQDTFGAENFFLEFQEHYGKGSPQALLNQKLFELQKEMQLQSIITNDLHYVDKTHSKLHDIFLCIQMGNQIDAENRFKFDSEEYYLKTPAEMALLYPDLPDALMNTVRIAEMCNVDPTACRGGLPTFEIPPQFESPEKYLYHLCLEGAKERFGEISERVRHQIDYELSIIFDKGFSSYFLIEWDFVNFARSKGIRCLARGSAAGSLVAYTLGITNVDPLRYQLLFERFLNPERNDMPDIDMDFPDDRREEVIGYVSQKYGADRVAQMVTFNTLGAKAAVRDVARVMGSQSLGDQVAKLIDDAPSIEDALTSNPALKTLYDENKQVKRLLDDAKDMEGYIRNTGVHAAGLVISNKSLDDIVPLSLRDPKNPDAGRIIQFEQKYYEAYLDLIKYDILGLANLGTIGTTIEFVKQTRGETLNLEKLPLDPCDGEELNAKRQKTFDLLASGETIEVFQLESPKMREYIKQLHPNTIEDIMAMVALYRPGPMDSIPDFIQAKHGRKKVDYLDPRLSAWLEESYGVIVYQDQVLQIAVNLAGFSWGKVNKFRKALSKKHVDEIQSYKGDFLAGCINNGVKPEVAEQLFTLILPFGGYGFNKAHAASYAVVAYYTAYLKANYTAEYMAAALSTASKKDIKQVAVLIAECKRLKIEVLGPDINKSQTGFSVENGNIRFGLRAIKGIGEGPCDEILQARQNETFTDLADFCTRVNGNVKKNHIEALIRAGAMDSLADRDKRHQLLASIDLAMIQAKNDKKAKSAGQISLFGEMEPTNAIRFTLKERVPEISRRQLLQWEKEYIGVYISRHPLSYLSHIFDGVVTSNTAEILTEKGEMDHQPVKLGGVIKSVRTFSTTKTSEMMCALEFEDMYDTLSVIVFPRTYEQVRKNCTVDNVVILSGDVRYREDKDEVTIVCADIKHIEDAEEEINQKQHMVWLTLQRSGTDEVSNSNDIMKIQAVKDCLSANPGRDQYEIEVVNGEWRVRIAPDATLNTFNLTADVRSKLEDIVGKENIKVIELG